MPDGEMPQIGAALAGRNIERPRHHPDIAVILVAHNAALRQQGAHPARGDAQRPGRMFKRDQKQRSPPLKPIETVRNSFEGVKLGANPYSDWISWFSKNLTR